MFKLRLRILAALWMVIMLGLPSAWAQENRSEATVYVIGSSHIRGDDMSTSREEAINSGLAMAVSRVLTDLLPAEILAGNFQLLNETLFSHIDQFIRDYKVLTESTSADTYRLLVQATVSVKRLKEAIKAAGVRLEQKSYPHVLFCVAEKRVHDVVPQYWWSGQPMPNENVASATLAQSLSEVGFIIVQPGSINAANYPPELSAAEASALGRQLKADVVVAGLASAEEAANTMAGTVRSYRATVSLAAYRVSDGRSIAQVQRTALTAGDDAYSGSREALHTASSLAAQDLSAQIGNVWFEHAAGNNRVEIVVQGVGGNIADFVKFRGALSTTSGVDKLQLKEMMADRAILSVEYEGNARALADALLLLGFDTFGINIESVQADTIQLQLVPR